MQPISRDHIYYCEGAAPSCEKSLPSNNLYRNAKTAAAPILKFDFCAHILTGRDGYNLGKGRKFGR